MTISPLLDSASWDVIQVGGVTCPGMIVWEEVPERGYEWDKKKGKGTKGETKTFVQMPASSGKVKFLAWTSDHFAAWDSFLPLFKYDPTKKTVQAIEIYHPCCADIELHSVVTEKMGGWKHEGKGLFSRTWLFGEYFPAGATSATSTPSGSQANAPPPNGSAPGDNGNDAQAQLDAENRRLADQAAKEGAI